MATFTSTRPAAATDRTAPDEIRVFDNGPRGRFNAWFFDTFDRYINFITRRHKEAAFAGMRPGDVVELGPGVGANFSFIPTGSRILAAEPNAAMHERLVRRADERGLALELLRAPAEVLPLPDASVDEVICSLVLCTVEDPEAVVGEVLRILRPGGTFRFVEHVGSHPASPRRWIQATIARPWAWVFEGCRLCRDTAAVVERAGFGRTEIERHRFRRSIFFPVNLAISGTATK